MQCVREHPIVLPPPHLPAGEPRDRLLRQEEKGGAYAYSAPRLRLFFIASLAEATGHKLNGFARFTRGSSPSGPLRAEPLEPTTPLILNGESEGFFLFVVK